MSIGSLYARISQNENRIIYLEGENRRLDKEIILIIDEEAEFQQGSELFNGSRTSSALSSIESIKRVFVDTLEEKKTERQQNKNEIARLRDDIQWCRNEIARLEEEEHRAREEAARNA